MDRAAKYDTQAHCARIAELILAEIRKNEKEGSDSFIVQVNDAHIDVRQWWPPYNADVRDFLGICNKWEIKSVMTCEIDGSTTYRFARV